MCSKPFGEAYRYIRHIQLEARVWECSLDLRFMHPEFKHNLCGTPYLLAIPILSLNMRPGVGGGLRSRRPVADGWAKPDVRPVQREALQLITGRPAWEKGDALHASQRAVA